MKVLRHASFTNLLRKCIIYKYSNYFIESTNAGTSIKFHDPKCRNNAEIIYITHLPNERTHLWRERHVRFKHIHTFWYPIYYIIASLPENSPARRCHRQWCDGGCCIARATRSTDAQLFDRLAHANATPCDPRIIDTDLNSTRSHLRSHRNAMLATQCAFSLQHIPNSNWTFLCVGVDLMLEHSSFLSIN